MPNFSSIASRASKDATSLEHYSKHNLRMESRTLMSSKMQLCSNLPRHRPAVRRGANPRSNKKVVARGRRWQHWNFIGFMGHSLTIESWIA